jgi:hypothetical protein
LGNAAVCRQARCFNRVQQFEMIRMRNEGPGGAYPRGKRGLSVQDRHVGQSPQEGAGAGAAGDTGAAARAVQAAGRLTRNRVYLGLIK